MSTELKVRAPSTLPVSFYLPFRAPDHEAIKLMKQALKGGEGSSPSLKSRCKQFAKGLWEGYKDKNFMMIFFEVVYAIPSRVGKVVVGEINIPALAFFAVPIYLYHTVKETIDRGKMVYTAIKVKRWSDALYYFLGGSSRGGFAVGIAAKPVEQVFTRKGMKEDPVVKKVFKKYIPSFQLVTSTMSGIRKVWDMIRAVKASRRFKRDANEPGKLGKAFEIFEKHWDGPSKADFADETILKFERKTFEGSRSTSCKRYSRLKEESDILKSRALQVMGLCFEGFDESIQAMKRTTMLSDIPEGQKIVNWHAKVQQLKEHIEKSETLPAISSEIKLFEELIETLSKSTDERFKVIKERLEADKRELEELVASGDYLVDRMKSEIHRKIAYNAIEIFMSILMISGGALALAGSGQLGAYFTLSSAIIDTIYILFDRIDDEEGFRKIESLFRSLTPAPHQLVALPEV
ncbi:MAG: hypothetical protein KR126chlam2_01071 [Chlamydiae bacterium]|nr:hypothetical protein [Chlamydiota bacterium]